MQMQMSTGLDFDGPIHNVHKLKERLADQLFGLKIEGKFLNFETVKKNQLAISIDQYREIHNLIYNDIDEIIEMMEPTEYAIQSIKKLLELDHRVVVFTARTENALEGARMFSRSYHLDLEFYGIGFDVSKKEQIIEIGPDNFVDDNLRVIDDLKGVVENLYLFGDHSSLMMDGAVSVKDWHSLLPKLINTSVY